MRTAKSEKLTRNGNGNFSVWLGENLLRLNPRARRGYEIKVDLPLWGRWLPVGQTDEVVQRTHLFGWSKPLPYGG